MSNACDTMEKQKEEAVVAARVSFTLKQLIARFIAQDTHMNESDFVRDAIREKIQRDAPELYRQLFQEVKTS
jgi:hypothetical protein